MHLTMVLFSRLLSVNFADDGSSLTEYSGVFGKSHSGLDTSKALSEICSSCFPHVVNLACKAVIEALTHVEYSAPDAQEYIPPPNPNGASPVSFLEALHRDPIATLRSLIRAVGLNHTPELQQVVT